MTTQTLTLTLLVTDTDVHLVATNDLEKDDLRERLADATRDAVLYRDATRFEVRRLTIEVPLLAPAEKTATEAASKQLETDSTIKSVFDEARFRFGEQEVERLRTRLLDLLSPGTYRVYRDPNGKGIKRID